MTDKLSLRPARPVAQRHSPRPGRRRAITIRLRTRHVARVGRRVAPNGGSVRARCEGLRYGPEPFGAHY